jgi:hypothetical protein
MATVIEGRKSGFKTKPESIGFLRVVKGLGSE